MKKITALLVQYANWVIVISIVLGGLGAYYSVLLYKNLRTNIEELLPTTARSVQDLHEVSARLESIDNIVVLFFSKNVIQSKRFVSDLAQELKFIPPEVISAVEYRIDKELAFFNSRRSLYIDLTDLAQIEDYIVKKINYETKLYNPINIFSGVNLIEPKLDYEKLKEKYTSKLAEYDHFPSGFYANQDETIRAMIVFMPGRALERALKVKEAVSQAIEHLDPKKYSSDLEVKYTGNAESMIEESAALVEDLEFSTLVVVVLVALAMVLFFHSLRATLILNLSLFVGTFWTFGAAYFAVGYLNANTAFLASIVIGNGINFGTILLARYFEESRRGLAHPEALYRAISQTLPSTLTAALAAGLSYGSLMLTGFRGFSQFGVIGLLGMALCWLSAYTLLPALLTGMERLFGSGWISKKAPPSFVAALFANWVARFPGLVWWTSVLGVLLSLWLVFDLKEGVIETDLSKLRDKRSMQSGSGGLYHYIHDIFGRSFSPMVILPKHKEEARQIAALLRKEQSIGEARDLIRSVQTLEDFIPKQQIEKIEILNKIKKLLSPKILRVLPQYERRLVRELLSPECFKPFKEKDLPPVLLSRFREKNGSLGNIVLVDKLFEQGHEDAQKMFQFVSIGRRLTDSVSAHIPVAGDLPISYDLFESVMEDGPRATLFAFFSVCILVILLFRNFKSISLCLFSLFIGVSWLAGIFLGLKLKINFLNFIALPITFGIGVDYGVNIFQRYRQEGPGRIVEVIRSTGGAVLLCSLTTSVGYGSLLMAGSQAFVSFGRLAVLGEITCVLAAVLALPAFLMWLQKLKVNKLKNGA